MNLDKYYQKRKNATRRKRSLFYLYLLLSLCIATWGFFWVSYFRISKIQVKDSYFFSGEEDQIKNALSGLMSSKNNLFLPKNNLFLFSSYDAQKILREKNFGIAQIKKIFPNKLEVTFQESQPKFIFCLKDNCYYLDQNGVAADKAPQLAENLLPLLILNSPLTNILIGDSVLEKNSAEFLSGFSEELKNINLTPDKIEEISLSQGKEFKVYTKEGWVIYLSVDLPEDKIFGDFKLLLDQKIQAKRINLEYIDLRFPDKAFYKLH